MTSTNWLRQRVFLILFLDGWLWNYAVLDFPDWMGWLLIPLTVWYIFLGITGRQLYLAGKL